MKTVLTHHAGEPPVVVFENVSFAFSPDRVLLRDVSIRFLPGCFYLLRGASGSGKSTFLRLINRLEEPLSGEILFKGRPLGSVSPPVLRRSILFIQQTPTVVDATVRENLMLPFSFRSNRGLPRPTDRDLQVRLDTFIPERVRLEDAAQALSVGQQQRLCFVRGLLLSPEILLLDEPTSALDERSSRIVEGETERLCRESGLTVIMVSHRRFVPRSVEPVMLNVSQGRLERA